MDYSEYKKYKGEIMNNKNKTFNVIMVVLIAVILVSSVMFVGNLKGWFGKSESADSASANEIVGSVNVERSGVAFSGTDDTQLRDGDIVETKTVSKATLISGENTFTLSENSEVKVISADNSKFELELTKGEVFCVINDAESFNGLKFDGKKATAEGTVFAVSAFDGSSNVNVFEGSVKADGNTAAAGEIISFVGDDATVAKFTASSLNEFNIEQAKKAASERELCFAAGDLQKVLDDRAEEMRKAAEEQAKHDAQIIAQGGTEQVAGSSSASMANAKTCTITIRCDTILDNMDNLTPGKNAYVPSNGCILATSTVQFVDGETVFDVLKRVCEYAGIQIEYSWTPMYNSYYIEGINNLYEFDCGSESGWMYKVNGWFPNYGCSAYTLKDGDVIVWCYTCNGLGADVGGGMY